jgi:hypothetical protein
VKSGEYIQQDEKRSSHGSLFHYPDETIEQYFLKMNEDTSLRISQVLSDEPTFKVGWMKIVFTPLSHFFRTYISEKRYKNGFAGFLVAVLGAINVLAFSVKLWEYRMREREGKGFLPPVTQVELNRLKQL